MNLDHLFSEKGAYALVDGQYGSTGKGLAAAFLAEHTSDGLFQAVLTNAGPNSGHTCYAKTRVEGEGKNGHEIKVVLKQLPTFPVYQRLQGRKEPITVLTAGAVVDPALLADECYKYNMSPFVHPNAALLTPGEKWKDADTIKRIASTGQGVGPAIINKLERYDGAVAKSLFPAARRWDHVHHVKDMRVLLEVSQGFSLGLNQRFYPYVTSRECTAGQALSDAGISPKHYRGGIMCVRTFPIRVGNAPNGASSGDCYPDQVETSWEAIGQEPELTTVTKRVRRVFTFSWQQYRDALTVNTPHIVFANFLNYLEDDEARASFLLGLQNHAIDVLGHPVTIIGGYGPRVSDCFVVG